MDDTETERMALRRGGWVQIRDGTVRIDRDDETVTIPAEAIRKIKLEVLKWGLAVMSAVTVVFGAYFAAVEHLLGGIGFAAVGVWSLHRTYKQRNTLVIWVDDRPKPIAVYPEQPKACHAAVAKIVRPDETPVTAAAASDEE